MAKTIQEIKDQNEARLFAYENVTAVAIGKKVRAGKQTDVDCIKVYVNQKKPESKLRPEQILPKEIDQIPTDVEEMEQPVAQKEI